MALVAAMNPQVRSAEAQIQAQGLAFPHRHVGPALAGGGHHGAGNGVDSHDIFGPGGMDDLPDGGGVLHIAVVVGLLEIEAGSVLPQHGPQGLLIGPSVLLRHHDQLVLEPKQ